MSIEIAGVLIGVGAFVVAAASLAFTVLERKARITELDLLRRQVDVVEEEHERRRQATLHAAHAGSPVEHGLYVSHEFLLLNAGPAIARAVDVWIRDDGSGEDITEPHRTAAALKDGEDTSAELVLRNDLPVEALSLWARWRDDSGDREDRLLSVVSRGLERTSGTASDIGHE